MKLKYKPLYEITGTLGNGEQSVEEQSQVSLYAPKSYSIMRILSNVVIKTARAESKSRPRPEYIESDSDQGRDSAE